MAATILQTKGSRPPSEGVEPACHRRRVWPWLLLLVAAIGVYLPALHGGFVWDDGSILTRNPLVPAAGGLSRIWFSGESLDYFPLTFTSFWLEWRLWGLSPAGYHAVNILLHAASAVLVWRVLLRLQIPGALLAALIFAVHPVNVATVAWVAERKNTLSMVFYLAAILWYLRFLESGKRAAYGLALGMFLLALLAKTSVIMLPVVLLLIVWWQKGRATLRDGWRTAPFFGLSFALGLLTIWFQNHRAIDGALVPMGDWLTRMVTAAWAAGFYLRSLLFPIDLSMLYPHWRIEPASWAGMLSVLLLGAGLGVAFLHRRGAGRPLLFGLGYFLISLFPVIGFFRMYYFRLSPVADQWVYVAEIGVIALGAAGLTAIAARLRVRWFEPAVGALLVVVLGMLTWNRASVLRDEESLWSAVLKRDPASWTATTNLALNSLQKHRLSEALSLARRSVEIEPAYIEGYLNLGAILDANGRFAEAVECYERGAVLRPDSGEVRAALAMALEKAGRLDDAMAVYQEALQLGPNHYQSRINLGSLLYRRRRFAEAATQFREAVRVKPGSADAHNDLAGALYLTGETEKAIGEYQEALRLEPSHSDAKRNLEGLLRLRK